MKWCLYFAKVPDNAMVERFLPDEAERFGNIK